MKIKSVAVLGAGAVGSYVIWGLSEKSDIRLGVIAEGERAERLKKNGCAINGKTYHPEVWTPDEAHDVDLMVVALKYGSLEGALESIQKVTGEHTVIMYPVRVLHAAQTARAVRRMCASDAAAACLSGRGALVHGLRLNLHAAGLARLFRTRVFAFSACKSSGGRTHGCLLRLWLSAVRRFGVLPGSPAGFRRSAAADAALSADSC